MCNIYKAKRFLTILAGIVFMIAGCKKNDPSPNSPTQNPTGTNNAPGQFTLSLEASSWDTAKIVWTKAIDPDNDSVVYKIYLNDTLKIQGFNGLNYTFRNLNELTTYNVKIVAVDNKLNETTSRISFTTNKYWLKFMRKVEYGPITGYSVQKTGQMVKANDGGYIIVGESQLGDPPYGIINLFTMKIDSLGNKIWQQRYNYRAGIIMNVRIINYNNGYIICGDEDLLRIDNNGNIVWHQTITLDLEQMRGISAGTDGSIFVVGNASTGFGNVVATLGKYDQNGNLIWKKTFSRTTREELYDIKVDSNNKLIVIGTTKGTNADFWVLKLNLDGSIIWEKTFPGQGYALPQAIINTREGNYVFTGFVGETLPVSFYLQMIDQNGNNKWIFYERFNTLWAFSVAETNDNSLIIAGGDKQINSAYFALCKFDKNGTKLWEKFANESNTFLNNKTVIPTSDGGYIINTQKSRAYNAIPETDWIYIFKTDDKGEFK
jgi:hypothetical protein